MYLTFIFLLIGFSFGFNPSDFSCGHESYMSSRSEEERSRPISMKHVDYGENDLRTIEQQPWELIRVHYDYSQLDGDVSASKASYVKSTIIPAADNYLKSLLKVHPATSNLIKLINTCGGDVPSVPAIHRTTGVPNADYVLYVSSKDTVNCIGAGGERETLAYAALCQKDQNLKPTFGFVNLCPLHVDTSLTQATEIDKFVRVMLHEIWHALGYSNSIFPTYASGELITRDIRRKTNALFFTGAKTKEKIQAHFGCNSMYGLELEEAGAGGTAGSHPDERVYHGDFMNGRIPWHPIITDVSVAMMEDSGWYQGIYENTEWWKYGENAGCDFVDTDCIINNEIQGPPNHFCNIENERKCTPERKAIGVCKGGDAAYYTDGCPLYITTLIVDETHQVIGNTDCKDPSNSNPDNLEIYGANSECFLTSASSNSMIEYTIGPHCYEFECLKYEDDTLKGVKIDMSGGKTVNCYVGETGVEKSIGLSVGKVQCPELSTVCQGEYGEEYRDPASANDFLSMCGIATLFDGDEKLEADMEVYREIRDKYLSSSKEGRWVIKMFYGYGEIVARILQKYTILKSVLRIPFYPINYVLRRFVM